MGWGNSFGGLTDPIWGEPKEIAKAEQDAKNFGTGWTQDGKHVPLDKIYVGWDTGKGDETVAITGIVENGILNIDAEYRGEAAKILIENYTNARNRNLKPTHDPYTNPDAHIYYECGCGAILDPQTKSFAALNNHASNVGWKIRFTDKGYVPYCVKCGEGVE